MLFNSFEFLLFLPIVFLLYWFVFKRLKWQNLFLVVASYVFYGWWDWRFLILIALTTLFSYVSGRLIARYEGQQKRQKALSAINIVLNLSILGVFKYYNFFAENFAALFGNIGWQIDWVTLDILLPVGISFYTFQALSYSIDVYQKKLPVCKDIIAFFAYGISNLIHQELGTNRDTVHPGTMMQKMFLGYLEVHEDQPVFQKDLESAFHIRRSTATGILQIMMRDGLIVRAPA